MKTFGRIGYGMLVGMLLTLPGVDAAEAAIGEEISVPALGLSYIEPNGPGWVRKYSNETHDAYMRVYVCRVLPKRELMILVEKTTPFDVREPEIQDHYVAMMPGATVLRRHIGTELGPTTLTLDFEHPWQDQLMKGRMLICYHDGYAFRCMVGTYAGSVATDSELIELLQATRISVDPVPPDINAQVPSARDISQSFRTSKPLWSSSAKSRAI